MSEGQKARGRARGRARGQAEGTGAVRQPGESAGPPGPRPPVPSAWGASAPPRPSGPAAQGPQVSRGTHRTQAGDVSGAQERMAKLTVGDTRGLASGEGGAGFTPRGGHRGGRTIPDDILRTRPVNLNSKKGTTGAPCNLISNHFRLLTQPKWGLYQYRVDFSPDEDRTFVRKSLLRDHKSKLGGYIFDGTVLYTVSRLNPDPMELFSSRKEDNEKMRMIVKLVGDVVAGDHHYIQVFNIIMRKCLSSLKLQLVGRDYFDQQAKIDIREHKLQIWPGYKTTINQHENNILMINEIAHKVLRMDTVLDLLSETYNKIGREYQKYFAEQIVGKIVLTTYNSKTYRVDDINWKINPECKFSQKGTEISYIDYFYQKYQVKIQDRKQPLLVSRAKDRDIRAGAAELICLIPELCRQTGLTDEMRANWRLMADMAKHTRVGPNIRVQKLLNFNERLHSTPEAINELKDWDMKLDRNLLQFEARVLPTEKIILGNQGSCLGDKEWTKDLRSRPMLTPAQVGSWAVLAPPRTQQNARDFAQMLYQAGKSMALNLPQPKYVDLPDDRAGTYVENCEKLIASLNPRLILCIVPNNRADRYSAIKKKCCVDRDVLTQVLLAKNLGGKNAMSVATKVAIQINCKLGGAAWSVEIPLANIMFVGYDVCHDTQSKEKSFGAMVASMDKSLTRYFSAVTPHSNGEELSNELSLNIVKALQKYNELNKTLPQKIIIYRDGVGDGQIPFVYNHEVKLIKEKLQQVYGDKPSELAFIIVSKRINTRFFEAGTKNNPRPGTIVDDHITLPERYDFFLVSQQVREGTVAPTSYNVISDNTGLKPDHLQRLTYKLCHLYFNWSGQVKVPAPCQYAHKLATLAGQSLHRQPNNSLDTLLYYL